MFRVEKILLKEEKYLRPVYAFIRVFDIVCVFAYICIKLSQCFDVEKARCWYAVQVIMQTNAYPIPTLIQIQLFSYSSRLSRFVHLWLRGVFFLSAKLSGVLFFSWVWKYCGNSHRVSAFCRRLANVYKNFRSIRKCWKLFEREKYKSRDFFI